MKQDARRDWDDGGERDELRTLLREWRAPQAPAAIEDALGRELRVRRPRPRVGMWLSLAACLALLASWPLVAPRRGAGPAAPTPHAVAKAVAPVAPKPEPAPPASARTVSARPALEPRAVRPRPKGAVVVVEASQAELLAEFGRRAWATPQAAPAAAMPRLNGAEAPAYRGEWEEVAGEWPVVQVVAPISGR
jgi:hypothetical protein